MDNTIRISVKDFISSLIDGIKSVQKIGQHYLSFSLISQGIEFLGACLDNRGWDKGNESKNRFQLAIKELFPSIYQSFNDENSDFFLYKNLRCELLHIILPKCSLNLIQRAEIPKYGKHLEIKTIWNIKRLILVSEDLFKDFKKAGKEVIRRIDDKEIRHQKVYRIFILA